MLLSFTKSENNLPQTGLKFKKLKGKNELKYLFKLNPDIVGTRLLGKDTFITPYLHVKIHSQILEARY